MTIMMPKIHKPNLILASNAETYRKAERGTLIFAVINIVLMLCRAFTLCFSSAIFVFGIDSSVVLCQGQTMFYLHPYHFFVTSITTLTSVVTVCSAVGAIFWFCTFVVDDLTRPERPPSDSDPLRLFFTYVLFTGIVVLLFFSLVAFMFACFLINGVCKKKPEHVKAYFVYGVVVLVLALSGATVWTVLTEGSDPVTLGIVLIVLVLYSMILSMIRVTYRSYEQRNMFQYGDQLLVVASETTNKI